MESEVRYVAVTGFREDGIGDIKGVFRELGDAISVVRAEYDEYCRVYGRIIVNKLFNENDFQGYKVWGEIRFENECYWFGCVKVFVVT